MPTTDMNQSFIRAFAKKDAAKKDAAAPTAEKKSANRPAMARTIEPRTRMESSRSKSKPAAPAPSESLYESESHFVVSSYAEMTPADVEEASNESVWTNEMAEAAQSAVAQIPREIAAKSGIPAPPKSPTNVPAEAKKAVQRIDSSHEAKPALSMIAPAWEIDRLVWPRTCEQLFASEKSYFDEAARRLVEASRQGMRTLAICGSRRGEGSSTIALCVARAAASAGLRVGILDADFQSDGLSEMLGIEVECSWLAAAENPVELDEQAVQSLEQPITLLPLPRGASRSLKSIGRQHLTFIPEVAEQFDLLIIDYGAFSEGALPLSLKSKVNLDAALVVRDLRHTSSRAVHVTVGQLREAGIEAVGIAENFGAR